MISASNDEYFSEIVWGSSKIGELTYLIFLFFLITADLLISLENLLVDYAYVEALLDLINYNYVILGHLNPSLGGFSQAAGALNRQYFDFASQIASVELENGLAQEIVWH